MDCTLVKPTLSLSETLWREYRDPTKPGTGDPPLRRASRAVQARWRGSVVCVSLVRVPYLDLKVPFLAMSELFALVRANTLRSSSATTCTS